MNGRRAIPEDDEYYGPVDEWADSNSFVQLLQRLEKINRGYD